MLPDNRNPDTGVNHFPTDIVAVGLNLSTVDIDNIGLETKTPPPPDKEINMLSKKLFFTNSPLLFLKADSSRL